MENVLEFYKCLPNPFQTLLSHLLPGIDLVYALRWHCLVFRFGKIKFLALGKRAARLTAAGAGLAVGIGQHKFFLKNSFREPSLHTTQLAHLKFASRVPEGYI